MSSSPNQEADERVGYHRVYGGYDTFEIFWEVDEGKEGWYWWGCTPGHMPVSPASGPFVTSTAAYDDARQALMVI